MPISIPNNQIAAAVLAIGLLLTIWCLVKGEGYAKQIKWVLMFFFLAAFVISDKFYTLKALDVLADLTNVDKYVSQLNEAGAENIRKLNDAYESKIESLLAEFKKTEKLANDTRMLMRLSVESAVYDQALKNNPKLIRKRLESVSLYLFEDEYQRDQWLRGMLHVLDKE
jgi:hypothetical protein